MLLDPGQVDPTPWRNAAGSTRELAVGGAGPAGAPGWRVSVADLARDAPFSTFPGTDRLLLALGSFRLSIDGQTVDLTRGEQVRFPGEATVAVTLDRPTQTLNVMTRRGDWHACVVLGSPDLPSSPGENDVAVLLGDLVAHITLARRPKDDHDRHRLLPPCRDRLDRS